MPPPLSPSQAPATPHMGPPMFQLPYGHHHVQQGRIPNFSAQQLFMLPGTYTRSETAQYAPAMATHLNASNPHHQAQYRHAPLLEAPVEGSLMSPPINGAALHTTEARIKTKAAKPKPKKPPPSKIVKPRPPKPGKVKQRPQMAKHLTPSLRAAIITLKVTDPSRSFKEIGKILSLPAEDVEDDEDDTDDDNDTSMDHEQALPKGNEVESVATTTITIASSMVNDSSLAGTTDPDLLSGAANTTEIIIPAPASGTPTTASKPKPKTKPKGPSRKPIPRNTVAGIFKRAVDRAGTDSDLFKLLEQTGRRAGSGRPRKGAGRKDREAEPAAAPGSVIQTNAESIYNAQQSLDTQPQPTGSVHNETSTSDSLSQTIPALAHDDSWQTHLAGDSMNGTIHSINEETASEIDGQIDDQINGLPTHSPVSDAADLTLDMGLDDDAIDMDSLEMDALDMPGSEGDDVARGGWTSDESLDGRRGKR